jgi:hypothetical protein
MGSVHHGLILLYPILQTKDSKKKIKINIAALPTPPQTPYAEISENNATLTISSTKVICF